MTIASAFNDIAVDQGGTASTSGAIDDAARAMAAALGETIVVEEATVETIDSLTDKTIEDAVILLGKHIGGGGGSVKVGTVVLDMVNMTLTTLDKSFFYPCKTEETGGVYAYVGDFDADPVTQGTPGTPVALDKDSLESEMSEYGMVAQYSVIEAEGAIASPADFVIVDMSSDDPLLPLPNKNTYALVGVDSTDGQ